MDDTPCADCTPEQQCQPCIMAEQQAISIMAFINVLPSDLQTIAFGITLGLKEIKLEQTDDAKLFVDKVKTHVETKPQIKEFLENVSKSYLTPWQFSLVTRCLDAATSTTSTPIATNTHLG
jgi:hypothetical protein